jgi:hypothetical protein
MGAAAPWLGGGAVIRAASRIGSIATVPKSNLAQQPTIDSTVDRVDR